MLSEDPISFPIYDPSDSPSDDLSHLPYSLPSPIPPEEPIPISPSDIDHDKPCADPGVVPITSPSYMSSVITSVQTNTVT